MKSRDEIAAFARETIGLSEDTAAQLFSFAGRGSDRSYHRFTWGQGNSAIVVSYEPSRVENTYFADIASALTRNSIPTPAILRHDPSGCLILMEDLGDTDLWTLRNEAWNTRRDLYKKTLEIVRKLHACQAKEFRSDRVKLMESFTAKLYKWERDYFRDNFVNGLCHMELDPDFQERLEEELSGLAEKLLIQKPTLVHRDLQSQNVMICRGEPYLIDFQGLRFGTMFYDLGSLLCDPYVRFTEAERAELLAFYYELCGTELQWEEFQKTFWEASAQRLMQALGAYGFLGIVKGLTAYLEHVPAGLRNLTTAAANAGSLPLLLEICHRCRPAYDSVTSV